jgi:hypothetical protein
MVENIMEVTQFSKFANFLRVCIWVLLLFFGYSHLWAEAGEHVWFRTDRVNMLFTLAVISAAILYYIYHATRGKKLFLRKIAGVSAVEEAVGRATEMGRSIIFSPGIQDMDDVQTLAGLNILGHVAYKAAEYDTVIKVPNIKALVMSTAQEVVKQAYLRAGRPDAYNSENVFYVTDEQFGYAAAVNGMLVREKPATVFMLGSFYAESLLLAETGNSIGAIQIAGTAQPSQIPFFVAACDYTLIGEELFAASAYLSNEPNLLGSLRGQDIGKILVIALMVLGIALELLVRNQWLPESWSMLIWFSTL